MRGRDIQQDTLFSTVIPEERVPIYEPYRVYWATETLKPP